MPLDIRKKQLMTNCWANLKGYEEQHLTNVALQECSGRGQRASSGRVGKRHAEDLGVINIKLSPMVVIPEAKPWTRLTPLTDMKLLELKKSGRRKVCTDTF